MKKKILSALAIILLWFSPVSADIIALHEATADLGGAFGNDFKLTMYENWVSQGLMNTEIYGLAADIQTSLGITAGAEHFGTFTGAVITDNQTLKTVLQELETAIEGIEVGGLADLDDLPGDTVDDNLIDFGLLAGAGDVIGPASATDNAIAVFDSTTGKLIKVSGCTINATTNVISCSAADGSRYATLPNNTSGNQPASATVVNGFYVYVNELYGVENSGTASKVLLENDVDDTPSDGNTTQPASSNSVADHIAASNPHSITATTVGLGNVDNTSNATERAATAALTNKDLSSGTNTFPATLVTGPSSLEIFVLDDCSTATGMATGDLCFEY